MANYEAISTQSPPRSSFIFQEDNLPAKKPSDDETTIIYSVIQSKDETSGPGTAMPTDKSIPAISPSIEHRTKTDSVLAWFQNVELPEDPRLDLRSLGVDACCAESNQHQRITNLHSPSLPSLADSHKRTMSSHELTPVSSASSSSPQCPIILREGNHADYISAKVLSNITVPPNTSESQSEGGKLGPQIRTQDYSRWYNHHKWMAAAGKMYQEIQDQKVVSDDDRRLNCVKLLRLALCLLGELEKALSAKPRSFLEISMAKTMSGYEESNSGMVVALFSFNIKDIRKLPTKSFAERFGYDDAVVIRDLIYGDTGLCKIMGKMRELCHESEHASVLPIGLRLAAVTVYFDFLECFFEVLVQKKS